MKTNNKNINFNNIAAAGFNGCDWDIIVKGDIDIGG